MLNILESLGQWDWAEFVVGISLELSTIGNRPACSFPSKEFAFVKPL